MTVRRRPITSVGNGGLRAAAFRRRREFIEHLASRSSASGEAYRVREGDVSTESGPWFLERLKATETAGLTALEETVPTMAPSGDGAATVLAFLRSSSDRFRVVESDEVELYSGRELARRIGLKHLLAGKPEISVDQFIERFCTNSSLHGTKYEVDGTPPSALAEWLRVRVLR